MTVWGPHQASRVGRCETQGLYILSIPGGYSKIGIAHDVSKRVRELQCGCPEKISIDCFWDVEADGILAVQIERELHSKLRQYRTFGEWFYVPEAEFDRVLRETWRQFRYPKTYARLQRMRAHKRASSYRKQA